MAFDTKKFLDQSGVQHLWSKVLDKLALKQNVLTPNDSIIINNDNINVQISAANGNALELKTTMGEKGLFVPTPAAADTYTIIKDANSGDYAAIYHLQKTPNGTGTPENVGVAINIPKDMVVSSGTVETKVTTGAWGEAGTYIHLILANADNSDLYIPVDSLIEYVTSGSAAGDMIFVTIDANHRVTATITDGTITKAKLVAGVQHSLDLADSAIQSISEGSTNGTIDVDGTDVPVHGLGSAAYTASTAYDAAGAAATAKSEIIGLTTDTKNANTIYGAKAYADDAANSAYTAITALSNTEIDTAITNAETAANS